MRDVLRRAADYARAATTLELPYRSIEGIYTRASAPAPPGRIPNVVYQTWVEPAVGRTHAAELRSFRDQNPDHTFEFFDTEGMDAYMRERYADHPILPVYEGCVEGPAKTDIWRYCIVYDRGGWYFDINKKVERPLRSFVEGDTNGVITLEDNPYGAEVTGPARQRLGERPIVVNWGFGFAPEHPLLRRTIDGIVEAYPDVKGKVQPELKLAIVHFTGPHRLTRASAEAIEAGEDEGLVIAGTSFDGAGVHRIHRSWVRYLQRPSYRKERDVVMVR